jgi:hypothetical protein
LGRHDLDSLGVRIVVRQGLWAWMLLADPQRDNDDTALDTAPSRSRSVAPAAVCASPPASPSSVTAQVLAAWTELVFDIATRHQAHP